MSTDDFLTPAQQADFDGTDEPRIGDEDQGVDDPHNDRVYHDEPAPGGDEVDLPTFLDQLIGQAPEDDVRGPDGAPAPAVAGTFAMYPHRKNGRNTGGIVIVMKIDEGPMKGIHRAPVPAGMIRMATALAGGGGKLAALTGGFRRRG